MLLVLLTFSFLAKSQSTPTIVSIQTIPQFPTIYDQVKISTTIRIVTNGRKTFQSLTISADSISICSQFSHSPLMATRTFVDTFNVGYLSEGLHTLRILATHDTLNKCKVGAHTSVITKVVEVSKNISLPKVAKYPNIEMRLYPQPVIDFQTISINTTVPQNIEVSLLNLSGKQLKLIIPQHEVLGSQNLVVDLRNLPKGVYFYQILAGKQWQFFKMVKQ